MFSQQLKEEATRHDAMYFATWINNMKNMHDLEKTQEWMSMMEETMRREN